MIASYSYATYSNLLLTVVMVSLYTLKFPLRDLNNFDWCNSMIRFLKLNDRIVSALSILWNCLKIRYNLLRLMHNTNSLISYVHLVKVIIRPNVQLSSLNQDHFILKSIRLLSLVSYYDCLKLAKIQINNIGLLYTLTYFNIKYVA